MGKTIAGYAATNAKESLEPFKFERRDPGPKDVQLDILFCGICHSDIHLVRNEWNMTVYPIVPGHEIVGRVVKVGKEAANSFKEGDLAAVGCLVDSCRTCTSCRDHLEQYCEQGPTFTYNSPDIYNGKMTYGGYSTEIVVDEKFVLRIPKEFKENQLPGIAPLLCAGITTYSPLKHWKVQKSTRVGVVGLGGLGHMAIKLAHAMGARVILFTTSQSKTADAKRLGADEVVISKNSDEVSKYTNTLDFIIDTVSAPHNLDTYLTLLKRDGVLCLVGLPPESSQGPTPFNLISKRKSLAGSLIGGIKETQEMLDFCAKHGITSDVEVIPIQQVNQAYERMIKSDVKYRFVIDMASLKP